MFFRHVEEHVFHFFNIFASPESVSFERHPGKPCRYIFHFAGRSLNRTNPRKKNRENSRAGKRSTTWEPGFPHSASPLTAVSEIWTYLSFVEYTRCPETKWRIKLAAYLINLSEMPSSEWSKMLIYPPSDVAAESIGSCRYLSDKYCSFVFL